MSTLSLDPQQRHEGADIVNLVELPNQVDHFSCAGAIQLSSRKPAELVLHAAIRHRIAGMSQRIFHLLYVFLAGLGSHGYTSGDGLGVSADEFRLLDDPDPVDQSLESWILHPPLFKRPESYLAVQQCHSDAIGETVSGGLSCLRTPLFRIPPDDFY